MMVSDQIFAAGACFGVGALMVLTSPIFATNARVIFFIGLLNIALALFLVIAGTGRLAP